MDKSQATITRYKSYLKLKQQKCDKLLVLLKEAAPIVCSFQCQSVKKSGTEWMHSNLCRRIQNELTLLKAQKEGK